MHLTSPLSPLPHLIIMPVIEGQTKNAWNHFNNEIPIIQMKSIIKWNIFQHIVFSTSYPGKKTDNAPPKHVVYPSPSATFHSLINQPSPIISFTIDLFVVVVRPYSNWNNSQILSFIKVLFFNKDWSTPRPSTSSSPTDFSLLFHAF